MRVRWVTPVLGAFCLISSVVVGNIDDSVYDAMSRHAQAQYHHNAVVGGFIGLGVSLAVILMGYWAWCDTYARDPQGQRPGCLGAVLALIAAFFWIMGLAFPPYKF